MPGCPCQHQSFVTTKGSKGKIWKASKIKRIFLNNIEIKKVENMCVRRKKLYYLIKKIGFIFKTN